MSDLVDSICQEIVLVTEGRLRRDELDATSRLWSLAGLASIELDSLEILALLYRLELLAGSGLPPDFELRATATIGDVAGMLAAERSEVGPC